ncbi:twin-arginine translocase subunit TatC [Marinoscillum sp. MHG1-6]|uniref:twin-arginine translocase subunit TatC n=1 Tax=Marinoscillum sp. MHG1-6 TaxID=2959627 RepID=UPI00215755B7|nr:twin-arginine translocase subunit TatC [Marinoscillum sp. MHG1-6]
MPLDQIEEESEMGFLDHLEELRWHIIRSLIAIVVFSIAAFIAKSIIFHTIILGPSRTDFWTYRMMCELSQVLQLDALCIDDLPFTLQSRQMTGQFTMHITASFVVGLIFAFPYAFWEIWRFIKPGLYPKERNATRGATFFVSVLFMIGVSFGYFIVSPLSINFLAGYQLDPSIINEFDIISYVTTLVMLVMGCGLLFQLPIVVYFLTKAGLLSPSLMIRFRRHAIVVILLLGAMLTPPDPFSQVLVAIPLTALYEIGIFISKRVTKRELSTEIIANE